MPSSRSVVHRHGQCLMILFAMMASLCTVVLSADSEWTWFDCQSSSTAASSSTNSMFWSNVVALLDALPSAAAPTGFASPSRGNGTDRTEPLSGESAAVTPRQLSAPRTSRTPRSASGAAATPPARAAVWYDDGSTVTYPAPMFCFLSYTDTNTSTAYENAYRLEFQNNYEVETTYDNTESPWSINYNMLMSSLSLLVVNGSATSPAPMFAIGAAVYDHTARNGTIYGLQQCMRDRTAPECGKCLSDSVQNLTSCCSGHKGGIVVGYNCYLRMEVYPFYDLALEGPLLVAPAPAPSSFVEESQPGKKTFGATLPIALAVGTVLAAVVVVVGVFLYRRNKAKQKQNPQDNSSSKEDIEYFVSEQLNLVVIRAATKNFSDVNKLGEGGFGEVFKGTLQNGEEIAVKRLSQNSSQGFHELKNELVLAAKLKHRNLVQLLGVCVQEEKLLIYEYMPNRSLDTFLLNPVRQQQLDWSKRFAIICGTARGLLYLHEESRLKVIHRDLKPSNVLLDADMNPKISDFGIARAFHGDQSRDITRRPVGTLGYMSPEYAYWGHVSSKSDMFSFGVIVLEMVTGRMNNSAYDSEVDSVSVLSHVWDKWTTGSTADVVDPLLAESGTQKARSSTALRSGSYVYRRTRPIGRTPLLWCLCSVVRPPLPMTSLPISQTASVRQADLPQEPTWMGRFGT